jgi:hypothetical protein
LGSSLNGEDLSMIAKVIGTLVDGELKLDQPLSLPGATRVCITVEPLDTADTPDATTIDPSARVAAWERFQAHLESHPLMLGGRDWTREDLYEGR